VITFKARFDRAETVKDLVCFGAFAEQRTNGDQGPALGYSLGIDLGAG
jgi:hypothetical protein